VTTEEFARNRDNFCYRHPDRQSFVLCQRCLRTICPECQTQGAVGVICPECMAEQRKAQTPVQRKAERRWARGPRAAAAVSSGRPVVTLSIIAVTALVYVLTLVPGAGAFVEGALLYYYPYVIPGGPGGFQPWRLITVALVHDGIWHIGLNMLVLWMLGRSLEPLLGPVRFLVLYLLNAIGGSVAVALLEPFTPVVGASGAIFGLFGALLIIGRHIGANITGIAVLIGINFALPFVLGLVSVLTGGSLDSIQISWQSHVGGFVAGLAVGFIYARTRAVRQRPWQIGLLVALTIVLLALLAVPPVIYG
jgi:membrane associated rhomboid family serine protease